MSNKQEIPFYRNEKWNSVAHRESPKILPSKHRKAKSFDEKFQINPKNVCLDLGMFIQAARLI